MLEGVVSCNTMEKKSFEKNIVGKGVNAGNQKMLVTSIYSFSNCFFSTPSKKLYIQLEPNCNCNLKMTSWAKLKFCHQVWD